jgi:hypothetical protein
MTATAPGADGPAVAVASLYQEFLVTRQTGRAVRDGIERLIAGRRGEALAVLDFRDVAVIDFSCADEVVAKLVLGTEVEPTVPGARFVLVRGVREHHLDPVEGALRRRGLAVAAERATGEPILLGEFAPESGTVWLELCRRGRVLATDLADGLGIDPDACGRILEDLLRRRLVRRCKETWESLMFTASCSTGSDRGEPDPEGPTSKGE